MSARRLISARLHPDLSPFAGHWERGIRHCSRVHRRRRGPADWRNHGDDQLADCALGQLGDRKEALSADFNSLADTFLAIAFPDIGSLLP